MGSGVIGDGCEIVHDACANGARFVGACMWVDSDVKAKSKQSQEAKVAGSPPLSWELFTVTVLSNGFKQKTIVRFLCLFGPLVKDMKGLAISEIIPTVVARYIFVDKLESQETFVSPD